MKLIRDNYTTKIELTTIAFSNIFLLSRSLIWKRRNATANCVFNVVVLFGTGFEITTIFSRYHLLNVIFLRKAKKLPSLIEMAEKNMFKWREL